jgi:hypothetical protein
MENDMTDLVCDREITATLHLRVLVGIKAGVDEDLLRVEDRQAMRLHISICGEVVKFKVESEVVLQYGVYRHWWRHDPPETWLVFNPKKGNPPFDRGGGQTAGARAHVIIVSLRCSSQLTNYFILSIC